MSNPNGRPVDYAFDHAVDEAWKDSAACRGGQGVDPRAFFPETEKTGHTAIGKKATARARAVCSDCPVRQQCLDYALETDSAYGIWGGLDPSQRRQLRKIRAEAANDDIPEYFDLDLPLFIKETA